MKLTKDMIEKLFQYPDSNDIIDLTNVVNEAWRTFDLRQNQEQQYNINMQLKTEIHNILSDYMKKIKL